jgi:peptidoglycan/xylan/chitin deacetylase (PgdA/CDA1 family)
MRPTSSGAANLTVLDWAGFKAAVSYTFDDANSSQLQNYPALNQLGTPLTFFLTTGKPEASDPLWAQAIKDGHEISNHSMNHAAVGTAAELDDASRFLQEKLGVTTYDMAAPYGSATYQPLAKTRFLLNRGVANGLISSNDETDPYNLPCFIPGTGAKATAFNRQIDGARDAGKWRVVLVHGFSGGTDSAYQPIDLAEFVASVEHAKSFGDLWIDTMLNIGAYWRAQKMFTAVTPTSAGDSQTWTWRLPANFPPGHYLRVKTDGGTLKQAETPLPWDGHGYYEVALDIGSLTWTP